MKRLWAGVLSGAVLCSPALDGAAAQAQGPRDRFLFLQSQGREVVPYWIGAMCVPIEETLRVQLGLKPGQGLVVANIMPESPAAAAGLKPHDVLVSIDDVELQGLAGLMKAVNDGGEKELKLGIIREGKRETLTIKPSKRPERDELIGRPFNVPLPTPEVVTEHARRMREHLDRVRDQLPEAEVKRMEEWIAQLERGQAAGPLRLHMFGPGVVMQPPGQAGHLPAGVSVSVTRQDGQPAKIHIERGDEKWDVSEGELDKLPPDLRGPVAGMLGGVVVGGGGESRVEIRTDDGTLRADRVTIVPPVGPGVVPGVERMAAEIEQLQRQVVELQKQVDAMRESVKPQAKPAEKAPAERKPADKKPADKKSAEPSQPKSPDKV